MRRAGDVYGVVAVGWVAWSARNLPLAQQPLLLGAKLSGGLRGGEHAGDGAQHGNRHSRPCY